MFIVNATFFCLFSFALVCLRISIRKRVSSKAFSFFTSGQGASTKTLTVRYISLPSPPFLSSDLPWSPACEGWSCMASSHWSPSRSPPASQPVTSLSLSLQRCQTHRRTWEIFLSGFCKTFPRRDEIMMVAEVEAEADEAMTELSLLNIC